MSRKPPKLFPIEDKLPDAPGSSSEKRVPECMPPLKPGGSIPIEHNNSEMTSSASSTSSGTRGTPLLRRSAPTRNFLNCNGASRRRFIGKSTVAPPIRALLSPSTTTTTPKAEVNVNVGSTTTTTTTTNGCGVGLVERSELTSESSTPPPPPLLNKVNGTMSNGISSSSRANANSETTSTTTRSIKRQKSLDIVESNDMQEKQEEDKNVSSDSHQQNSSSSINGKSSLTTTSTTTTSSVENSNSNSVSLNNSQSQNQVSNSTTITRRTSRFSQVSNLRKAPKPPTPTTTVEESDPLCPDPIVSGSGSSEVNNSDDPAPEEEKPKSKVNEDENDEDDQEDLVTSTPEEGVLVDGEISDTPKIIRQGDTVIKSYVDDKTGRIVVYEKGMNLEVCDFGSGKWYPAKVNLIDWNKQEILVHYSNWSSRFDEWISMNNNRLRPSKNTNVVKLQYVVGEKVEAVWPGDNFKYPGTILQVLANDMYDVLFEDGIKMKRNENQLFKISQGEQPPSLERQVEDTTTTPKPTKPPSSSTPAPKQPPRTSVPTRRRSMKASAVQSSNQNQAESTSAVTSTPPPASARSKARGSVASAATATATPEPTTTATVLETSAPLPSRPAHFSVFDVPKEDLGKRKRSVPNYYVLAKGTARGTRRPRSEGGIGVKAATNSAPTTDDESSAQHEDSLQVDVPESVNVTTPSPSLPPSRRRKSLKVPIPSAQSSPVEPKPRTELPALSAPEKDEEREEVSEEKIESPKKRRQPSSNAVTSTSTSTPLKELSSPVKPELVPQEVQAPPSSSEASTSTSTTSTSATAAPSTSTSTPTPTPSRRPRSVGSVLALLPASPAFSADVPPKDTKVDSGFVDESGNPIIIEQNNDGNGFWQCPLPNCGKNFRKDSLLKMHLKHYHPELKPTCLVANVVQMAQARHAFENYTVDLGHGHHHGHLWPKSEHSTTSTRESSPVGKSDITTATTTPEAHPQKSKTTTTTPPSQLKDASNEKVSPHTMTTSMIKSEQDLSPSKQAMEGSSDLLTPDPSLKALSQSPRLRHKRTFVWTKSGHRKSALTVPPVTVITPRRKHGLTTTKTSPKDKKDNVVIGTEVNAKKNKLADSSPTTTTTVDKELINLQQQSAVFTDSPASGGNSLSNSNTPSPSVISSIDHQKSIEDCSASSGSSEQYLVPELGESYSSTTRPRGRWGKGSHIRRGLITSGMRRSAPTTAASATQILLKRRLGNYRKLMRRQKRTSILSRISSGRMRTILDSLNQRSLKKKRFLAIRRGRDVKVDVINCVCSNKTEFGLMIQCELCLCWQHGSCFNVQTNSQLPDFYACQSCSEPEKSRLSRKYEWAESEFYKLGKLPSFPSAPSFPKEDARTMKLCTNLTSDLAESYSMIKSLKCKERICFGHPEHPQLYQWNTERPLPQEEIQRDKFHKYFQPVLRRLLLENKSNPAYPDQLRKIAETRLKLRKYSDAIESARSTIKKKLGCRAAAFLDHICESVLGEMIKHRRNTLVLENGAVKKELAGGEVKKRSAETAFHRLQKVKDEILRRQQAELKLGVGGGITPSITSTSSLKTTKQQSSSSSSSFMNGASVNFSMKGASSNGLQKDIAANIKDFCLLKKYLKDRRTLDSSINLTIIRMSKEFPEDWRNLMKLCRAFIFVDESVTVNGKESMEDEKMKWVSGVVVTFNNLKILLRQIFSETNGQRQKNCASEFEKATIKLFDLFGVGLTEEKLAMEKKKISPKVKNRRIRGLETLDIVRDSSPNLDILKLGELPQSLEEERSEILDRLGSTTGPISQKDCEDLLATAKQVAKFPGVLPESSRGDGERKDDFCKARGLDARLQMEFTGSTTLQEAMENIDFPLEECTEENVQLIFDDEPSSSSMMMEVEEEEQDPNFTGIIPVPAASRITPEVCRKNLVQDILLQQQQIDLYLDKIEGQIIKLASQSRFRGSTPPSKPSDLSLQRDKMLHSLELVNRLTKTMLGENDPAHPPPPPPTTVDMDVSETTLTDDSSVSSSPASYGDEDNTSNYSGTDTETADEGDNSGNDELLDV